MALSTFVYIRDVNNLSDARYCAGMGVEMIGFKLDQNQSDSLSQATFKEISDWISGVKIVGEFGNTPIEQIEGILADSKIDYLLVPDVELLHAYGQLDKPLILQLNLDTDPEDKLAALNFSSISFDYLLVTSNESSIEKNHKIKIIQLSQEYQEILGYGINEQNAKTINDELGLTGISLAGSSEIRPGFKDYDELADILETLEMD